LAIKPSAVFGRKRRFGIAGFVNVAITNLVLQILLATSVVNVLLATLISQSINTIFGYLIYGKLVFKAQRLKSHKPVLKYLCLMALIWLMNYSLIEAGAAVGVNKSFIAAALIPAAALLSYISQKNWIFNQ